MGRNFPQSALQNVTDKFCLQFNSGSSTCRVDYLRVGLHHRHTRMVDERDSWMATDLVLLLTHLFFRGYIELTFLE